MAKPKKNVVETPYLAARREWNERYGDYVKSANSWRLIAFSTTLSSIILAGGFWWQASQQKVVPYAVQFGQHGDIVSVQRADVAARPTDNQLRAALRNWVIGARTVYVDRRAQQVLIDGTYAGTLPDSAAFQSLASYHREQNPYFRSVQETVEIAVNAVVPVSDETWQVEWTETVKQRSGRIVSTRPWQGTFTVIIAPPTDEAQIMVNPLGIYVRQFAWTQRLVSGNQ